MGRERIERIMAVGAGFPRPRGRGGRRAVNGFRERIERIAERIAVGRRGRVSPPAQTGGENAGLKPLLRTWKPLRG